MSTSILRTWSVSSTTSTLIRDHPRLCLALGPREALCHLAGTGQMLLHVLLVPPEHLHELLVPFEITTYR